MFLQLRYRGLLHSSSTGDDSNSSRKKSNGTARHANGTRRQTSDDDSSSSSGNELHHMLLYLARCPERTLMLIILVVRMVLLLTMLLAHRALPVLFGVPSLSFDTCETLYEDARFTEVRNWDTVHFYHIARHGYTHENLFAFFPLVPLLIRAVMWLTQRAVPWLGVLAPVSFYMSAINIAASCVAGVVLRRLTILTFVSNSDAGQLRGCTNSDTTIDGSEGDEGDAIDTANTTPHHAGSRLDRFPCLEQSYLTAASPAERHLTRKRRQCIVGGALLLWIITPAMVFTVAVYTESLFSLFTFLGIYCLALGSRAEAKGEEDGEHEAQAALLAGGDESSTTTANSSGTMSESGCVSKLSEFLPDTIVPTEDNNNICAKESTSEEPLPPLSPHGMGASNGHAERHDAQARVSYLVHAIPPCTPTPAVPAAANRGRLRLQYYVLQLPSSYELVATLCFVVASGIRSNAFLCIGFVLYPAFLQLCFPAEYARRSRRGVAGRGAAAQSRGSAARRWPGVLRLLVLLAESALIAMPYMLMNYIGWRRFAPMWSAEERARLRHVHFWGFYRLVQRKYWNVNFLSSYNWANSPNVAIALPVALEVAVTMYAFYVRPIFQEWHRQQQQQQIEQQEMKDRTTLLAAVRTQLKACYALVGLLVQSCNVVYLLVLCLIAFSVMHIQVSNRFLMSCPALYWLWGCQLALYPRHWLTRFTLASSLGWAMTGALLFPNHMPWT